MGMDYGSGARKVFRGFVLTNPPNTPIPTIHYHMETPHNLVWNILEATLVLSKSASDQPLILIFVGSFQTKNWAVIFPSWRSGKSKKQDETSAIQATLTGSDRIRQVSRPIPTFPATSQWLAIDLRVAGQWWKSLSSQPASTSISPTETILLNFRFMVHKKGIQPHRMCHIVVWCGGTSTLSFL